jgi:hypothetical protein
LPLAPSCGRSPQKSRRSLDRLEGEQWPHRSCPYLALGHARTYRWTDVPAAVRSVAYAPDGTRRPHLAGGAAGTGARRLRDRRRADPARGDRRSLGHHLAVLSLFADLQIDWQSTLPDALREAAAASSPRATQSALAHLLTHLRDNHLKILSYLIDRSVSSPTWKTPIVPTRDLPFLTGSWQVRPQATRLAAKVAVLIDGRTMSSAETVLHMIRTGHVGVLVGEPSAGGNGNVSETEVPGGFAFRFTAIRASNLDGSTVHGHGFTPDHVVHPTLAGVRAGRDEILAAGLTIVQRLIAP